MGMKIRGFFEDLSGIKKITKARQDAMENASAELPGKDPIREIADTWHPGELELIVQSVTDAGKDAKSFRFAPGAGFDTVAKLKKAAGYVGLNTKSTKYFNAESDTFTYKIKESGTYSYVAEFTDGSIVAGEFTID